ncbi:MAG: hypothetical protein HY584_02055 [Candidatus Omnitrophica bacterium]|nr:hypothetical protein [Candidatus Omnitrophota bacterium]
MGSLLTVVMADPTNEKAILEIEATAKCKIQVFVATASEISRVIQEHYHISLSSIPEATVDASFRSAPAQSDPEKMAHRR